MKTLTTRTGITVRFTFLVIYLAALSAFGSFVNDMYVPSLPSMTGYFHCSVPTVQLGLTFGMIGLGLGQILLGPFSDKYGRKPILVASVLVFIAGAVASLFSPTIHFFLGCRLVQGIGASGGYFLARSIPTDFFQGRQLAKTMAIVGAINGFAPASAPVIGGFVSQHFDWKGVFVVLTAFAVILLAFSPMLKESLPAARREQGSVWKAFKAYGPLLCDRPFMTHVLLKGAALGLLFAYISSAPFIMQTHYGFRQDVFGCIMGANSIMVATGSMLALRFKPLKRAAFTGGVCVAASVALESVALLCFDSFWLYELLLLPILFSLGMIFTAGNTLAMNEGRGDAGDASAILGVAGYAFGAVVAPLVGRGDIMHSTAWVFIGLAVIIVVFSLLTRRVPADLEK